MDNLSTYWQGQMENNFEAYWVDYLTKPKLNEDGTEFIFNGLKDAYLDDNCIQPVWDETGENLVGISAAGLAGYEPGIYRLVETVVPQGFNKADDLFFMTDSLHENGEEGHSFRLFVTELSRDDLSNLVNSPSVNLLKDEEGENPADVLGSETISVSEADGGIMETTVLNVSGTMLPSTGGSGTTMLYVGGSLLMLLAVGFIVIKVRKKPDVA